MIENKDQVYGLIGSINDDSVRELTKWFTLVAPANKTRYLIINSGGGNVSGAFALVDMLMAGRGTKLVTIALGQVSSMAILIFLCGTERLVGPRSKFMIHELGRGFEKDDRWSTVELGRSHKDLENSQRMYREFVSERTSISEHDIKDFMINEQTICAEDAVKLGIAHEILTSNNYTF